MGEKPTPSQKQRIMEILQVDAAQADEILACDKAIDQGKRVYFDLPPDEEKQAKKWCNVTEHKRVQRKVQPNETKVKLVCDVAEMLTACGITCKITNPSRQVTFTIEGTDYEWTLVQKRKNQ